MTECKWSRKQYIGETKRKLRKRFKEHRQATKTPLHATASVVCYTVVFTCRHATLLPTATAAENRTTFLCSVQPIRIQLPFSGRRSRDVCGTVTPPITALLLAVPHM